MVVPHWVSRIGLVGSGVLAGTAIAVSIGGLQESAAAPRAAAEPLKEPVPTVQRSDQANSQEVAELRSRLAALEARSIASPPVNTPVPKTAEEAVADDGQRHIALLAAHNREGVDGHWTARANQLFEGDLEKASTAGSFRVLGVDCRTTTCTTQIEWPSYAVARERYGQLLQQNYQMNCAREVYLEPPDPSAEDKPFQATAYFDCERLRAEGN